VTPTDRTAVVTGASSGIGAATARALAGEGCNVVLAARRKDRLEELAAELGANTLPIQTDVTDPTACEYLVEQTIGRFGAIDVLVNNAGLGLYATIPEGDPEDWRRMFDVNVLGVLHATRAAVRPMLERGSGDIVFISSLAGRRVPRADGAVYAATKHAITAITQGLRMDVTQRGIRVINVEPGLVRTEFPESTYPSADQFYKEKDYAPVEAEDVAAVVLYAVSQPAHVSVDEVLIRPSKQPK
jgi:NADP-dependent 3-hydroxy acid dehydrogenase YdfG